MLDHHAILSNEETLDPVTWDQYQALGHQAINDLLAFTSTVAERPVWQAPTAAMKALLGQSLPTAPTDVAAVYADFLTSILPFAKGNIHPLFFSWVEGNGTFSGALADFLASAMNSNLAIGDHGAVYVEHQVINWCKELMGYPADSSGLLVSGGSMANITALTVARNAYQGGLIRRAGLRGLPQLVVYCSTETHNCLAKAVDLLGIGTDYLRRIPVEADYRISLPHLREQVAADRAQGLAPFCLIGNAGTVNTGAIDPLAALAEFARQESLWFHVDGAFGAVATLVPEYQEALRGLEVADSIAFDLHKWLYVNYEAGCVLIRDAAPHRDAFRQPASYLTQHDRGLAAGPEPFGNYGLELSRGFKSLKIWFSLLEHGKDKYARLVRQNIAQAFYLGELVAQHPQLELLTPVTLNIVCYRFNPGSLGEEELNHLNKELLMTLQERGLAAPSYTILDGRYAIRANITNHRTTKEHLQVLVAASVLVGQELAAQPAAATA